ncbi:MAG TPA: EF-P beta-lysylation protein EpmB [Gammaproteobacteria bacterium]
MNIGSEAHRPTGFTAVGGWQHAVRNAVRSVSELLELLALDPADLDWFEPPGNDFPLRVPRGYIARMRRGDPHDPLLRQVLPTQAERGDEEGYSADPLREVTIARNGLLEKYPGRLLLVTTPVCPIHCRYCFRRHYPYDSQSLSRSALDELIADLERRTDVREIILSGGDPLSLSNSRLRELVVALGELGSVTTLRIHTRFPIVLPERVDRGLQCVLERSRLNTVIVTHCNHANELDSTVISAIERFRQCGATLLNQSVLLRGVNDNVTDLESLSYGLFEAGILPYYLHQLDRVAGAAHFEVSDARAEALVGGLRDRVAGYLVPRLVREIPGELSKKPLGESHL